MSDDSKKSNANSLILRLLDDTSTHREIDMILKNELDWEHFFDSAENHRIVPLLFKRMKTLRPDSIPKEVFRSFQNRFQQIAANNFARSTQLLKLVELLQNNDLPVIAYKGMALAQFAYGDVTLRQFTDIDLLIQKKNFGKVKNLLIDANCRPAWDLTDSQEKAVLKYYYEYPFFYGDNNVLIEVHWEFLEKFFAFDFAFDEVWKRTVEIKLYGKKIQTLSAEDYLLFLCAHGSKHFWKRLSWIRDVAEIAENKTLDWQKVQKTAKQTGAWRMVLLGLYLAEKISGTTLSDEIKKQIESDPETAALGEKFFRAIFDFETIDNNWKANAKTHFRLREKSSTKIKYSYRLFKTKLIDKLFMPMGRPQ